MTNPNNPLLPLWQHYEIARDTFEIANKVVTHSDHHNLLDGTCLGLQSSRDAKSSLRETFQQQVNDLFVISFWATFERFLRDYLQKKGTSLQKTVPTALGQAMYTVFEGEVEYWNLENILENILKDFLGPQKILVSQAKHILHYRNWVAHGKNPNIKTPPSRVSPQFAYKTLGDIIELLIINQ